MSDMRLVQTNSAALPSQAAFDASDISVHDNFLSKSEQAELFSFLSGPGWAFGAYSDPNPGSSRYWYKHFAGIVRDEREKIETGRFEGQLAQSVPLISKMWCLLRSNLLREHMLLRCYANGYPSGSEGGVHIDSNLHGDFTSIYYPHESWNANFGGETIFFNGNGNDILKAVFPKPNRLVVFPGLIPHVARGVSRSCPVLRITLMFKTRRQVGL
jgi:SM-20-related protein